MIKYTIPYFGIILTIVICLSCNNSAPIPSRKGMVYIPEGILSMGGDNAQADPNELPKHKVRIRPFFIDLHEVTNAQFSEFVAATNYITVAERPIDWIEMKQQLPEGTPKPPDSLLAPGALVFQATSQQVALDNPAQWWQWKVGADWRHPTGPTSYIKDKMNHPVVQIAWEDAVAYCEWAGKRLPTEAEWEWAARGGLEDMIYPWGDEQINDDQPQANYFQGLFPVKNTLQDGFEYTAPVKSFKPNGYGLYDMSGNVWEWCQDWFNTNYYQSKANKTATATGPDRPYNPLNPYQKERVIRGGSFLCNESYCSGYRNARRMGSTMDTGLNHTGFRCVQDIPE